MTWIDLVGYLAALTVLMTFCMDTIVPLRGLAIASNVLFIVYGIAGQLYPVLLLHALLLPINVTKIARLQVRGINARRKGVGRGRRGIQ
jgi:CRP/FNR family cyclic AMP-dependent transcriptional regulator